MVIRGHERRETPQLKRYTRLFCVGCYLFKNLVKKQQPEEIFPGIKKSTVTVVISGGKTFA
jgi:hypothetical protein